MKKKVFNQKRTFSPYTELFLKFRWVIMSTFANHEDLTINYYRMSKKLEEAWESLEEEGEIRKIEN